MKKFLKSLLFFFIIGQLLFSCSAESTVAEENNNVLKTFNYLALGDSYTIGQNVCETCRFPIQLQDSIKKYTASNDVITTKIIATTGWTTTNLKNAIASQNPANNYDLVTLLIGVNNQYQNQPFSLYEQEFPELVNIAITKAKGIKANVIVISIPDYAYTPFGNGNATISTQVDTYNAFAENYCIQNNITFINITDITRQGLSQPNFVANDGLHPSEIAYTKFVERILPKAKEILGL
ncbi:SGNH/GDSL hydrolase family protein [Flavobacterium dankookense]|uniref:Lysophospholipase L1-like esterase n=1 Tax=Flavobacterium dankookense TaxID=706186 RepID=A0A4R6QBQ4_9FLAO|nr:SGNH/GDSL hydrolase family protein [Flavobacterium dankookense]TDP58729.1 lysophospholipase L1-like esterase [Flavobacterium dankookense]